MQKENGCGSLQTLFSHTALGTRLEDNLMTTLTRTVCVFIDHTASLGVTKVVEKGINTSAKERQSRTCEHFYSMDFDVKKSFAKYVLKFTSMF